jgi:glycyl-tRNA synthetase beta chain
VGEFPELQGTMGRYYALADGEPAEVAQALEEHYLPRFSGDRLPSTEVGRALAIADRFDTLAGIFAIEQRPTGAKDPFGLRRAALGILRILFEARWDADLSQLAHEAVALQPVSNPKAAAEVFDFLIDRLRGHYLEGERGISGEMFDAVAAAKPSSLLDFDARLCALQEFLRLPDAVQLAAANKRIVNILKKLPPGDSHAIDASLFTETAESLLHGEIERTRPSVDQHVASGEYTQGLQRLTALRPAVDAFFEQVMVMDENAARRNNRIALLAELKRMMSSVADLARLPV